MNSSSILNDIKLLCGVPIEVKDFDTPIMLHCNTVFSGLMQMGLNTPETFYITDNSWCWYDIFDDTVNLHNIKSYVYLKVKLLFDPPANATLISSMNAQVLELEWRIRMELETMKKGEV